MSESSVQKRAAELMLDRLKQLPPVASAMVPKPRKVVPGKKKSRNLIKTEPKVSVFLYSAVACVSEHAVIQHFFCHFINVLEIEKKHFQWLPIHINKTF